jgi:hypothetical protein
VRLEYPFGGRRLGLLTFDGRVNVTPWTTLSKAVDDRDAVAQLSQCSLAQLFSHPVAAPLARVALVRGAIRYAPRHYNRYSIETVGTFDDYLRRLGPKTRQTLKRKVRQYCVQVGSPAPWRRFETLAELQEFHSLARRISAGTYQERLFNAGLPAWREFRERIEKADGARGFLLYDGTRPTAFLFTPVHDRRAIYASMGYDLRYARWSPGAVLQFFAVESMFDDAGIILMDFAEGEGQHKATFATNSTVCADIYYFRLTLRAIAAVASHMVVRSVDRAVACGLDCFGLKRTLRKLLRRSMAPGSDGVHVASENRDAPLCNTKRAALSSSI